MEACSQHTSPPRAPSPRAPGCRPTSGSGCTRETASPPREAERRCERCPAAALGATAAAPRVALDKSSVYFTYDDAAACPETHRTLARACRDGSNVQTLLSGWVDGSATRMSVADLALDGRRVYFTSANQVLALDRSSQSLRGSLPALRRAAGAERLDEREPKRSPGHLGATVELCWQPTLNDSRHSASRQ